MRDDLSALAKKVEPDPVLIEKSEEAKKTED